MLTKGINSIVFDNEILIFWNRVKSLNTDEEYGVYLNGKTVGKTRKTHYEFEGLKPECLYKIKVELISNGSPLFSEEKEITTKKVPETIDVTKPPYNAVGDGKTLNTTALQHAISDCKQNGRVYFPKGTYLSGGLTVGSNIEIYLDSGAVLKGSENHEDYLPKIKSRFEGIEQLCYKSLINIGELNHKTSYNVENVVIRGGGSVIGGGNELRSAIINAETLQQERPLSKEELKQYETPVTVQGRARGRLIQIANAKNAVLSNLRFENSPSWNIHFIYSDSVITERCHVRSIGISNGDGWDPDSSTNCVVYNTVFETGDDSIAIKSGKNPEGNIINKPSENINVFDCLVKTGASVAIGSEMSGGVKNVNVWDCDFGDALLGIEIKSALNRGGYVKDVCVTDSKISRIYITETVGYNNDGEPAKEKTELNNFTFENLEITGYTSKDAFGNDYINEVPAISIFGNEKGTAEISGITVKNCKLSKLPSGKPQHFEIEHAKKVSIENLEIL